MRRNSRRPSICSPVSSGRRVAVHLCACAVERAVTWSMVCPPRVAARISLPRGRPPHLSDGCWLTTWPYVRRIASGWVWWTGAVRSWQPPHIQTRVYRANTRCPSAGDARVTVEEHSSAFLRLVLPRDIQIAATTSCQLLGHLTAPRSFLLAQHSPNPQTETEYCRHQWGKLMCT